MCRPSAHRVRVACRIHYQRTENTLITRSMVTKMVSSLMFIRNVEQISVARFLYVELVFFYCLTNEIVFILYRLFVVLLRRIQNECTNRYRG